jgi:phosphatidylethanolamine/phosphatidyl-N-methylethanolamine N-methyltransferase
LAHPVLTKVKDRIDRSFGDEIRFFKGWMDSPKGVGSVIPTSDVTARRMASIVRPHSALPVLELGPGTGVITKAILAAGIAPQNLVSIEYSADFATELKRVYPDVRVIEGDAFDLDATLHDDGTTQFDCVISAIPLLSFPKHMRTALMIGLLNRIPTGRPVMQITYGPRSPVPIIPGVKVRHFDFVVRNVPPAQLWTYTRIASPV